MKTQLYPEPECTCMRVWLAVIPPPPCPVHGQAYMLKVSNMVSSSLDCKTIKTNMLTIKDIAGYSITTNSIVNGSIRTRYLDGL